ncbi:MAG: pyridoxamine 5'-phosphate oxidase family protein [Chloroflexi bacterium]|nr:pyridoxamine 5'-phosphate oxidase family protein [Chloroflexota bacterium]
MAKLTEEMMEFVKGKMAYVATVGPDGRPNVGPKGSFRVFDDEHIGWNESTGKRTFENLQNNPEVSLAIVDGETRQGYRFTGKAEVLRDGPVYESTKEEYAKFGRGAPLAVVRVLVDEIYLLAPLGKSRRLK